MIQMNLFTKQKQTHRHRKLLKRPSTGEKINKLWYIHIMEYYSEKKKRSRRSRMKKRGGGHTCDSHNMEGKKPDTHKRVHTD